MRRAEDYAKMVSNESPRPRGIGDNNRGDREVPQHVLKSFQTLHEVNHVPVTNVTGVDKSMPSVPFNINESGKFGGGHY